MFVRAINMNNLEHTFWRMREGEKGEDLNYKLTLNPGHKTTAKLDVGKRLTQIKFKQIAYVMHEMKETKASFHV